MPRVRPTLFIGSSTEGHPVAKALQVLLDQACEVTIWSQGVFGLSQGTLESLVSALEDYDFAVLALTPDDLVNSRDTSAPAPRDNVLFELGLFMGALGRQRTYLLFDRTAKLKLPTDLAGVSAATYEPHASGNLRAALGSAATQIEDRIAKLGIRAGERLKQLSVAAESFDTAAGQMQRLVELIARSRKVELDIITTQFGSMIPVRQLNEIKQDLFDLDATLAKTRKKNEWDE